jgi:hypothetical protein
MEILNRKVEHETLKAELEDYVVQLKKSDSHDLRSNLRKKMDFLIERYSSVIGVT